MRDAYRAAALEDHRRAQGFGPPVRPDVLLKGVDAGLFAAVFVLPFVMGGRQAIGELCLTVIACWTAAAWLLRQTLRDAPRARLTGMMPLLVLGIALGVLQSVSLSPEWLARVSPHQAELLPAWSAEGMQSVLPGPWSTISLTPYETRRSVICLIACALLFLVAVNRLQTLEDIQRLVRCMAVAMTLMALFGSLQFLYGNGRFFGFYDHPFTNTRDYAKGAFTNPNHFADYVAMAIPLLLAWYATYSAGRKRRRHDTGFEGVAIVACLGCVAVAVLLSQSRGGLLAACLGTIVCLFFLHRVKALNGRTAGVLGGIACVALLSLTLMGDRIVQLVDANFHELASADVEQLDRGEGRQKIWQAAIAGIRDYPLAGTGLSSHQEVYWTYFDHPDDGTEFSHAENGYLQLGLETGIAGLSIAGCCVLMWLVWCLRGLRTTRSIEAAALLAATLGVVAINLSHSVTDFVWYAPAIMVVIVLLAASSAALCRLALSPQGAEPSTPRPGSSQWRFRPRWGIAFALMLVTGAWMVQTKYPAVVAEPYWFEYMRLVQQEPRLDENSDRELHRRRKYAALLKAAHADRFQARIQMRAAQAYQVLFSMQQQRSENPMSLLQIQDAALASEWESVDQLTEWLNRPGVLGENRKYLDAAWQRAVYALSLCPLQAEGYVVLSELGWIYGATPRRETQLLGQALTVRPFDPEVHYVAGRVVSLRGDEEAALGHWKESFGRSPRFRSQITSLLAPLWPAEHFAETFEPDTEALQTVVAAYRSSPDVEGYRMLAARLAEELSDKATLQSYSEAVRLWREAHALYLELGDDAGAERTARAAVEADPNNLQARRSLARWLYSQESYTEAIEHLQWVKRRSPTDREVAGWLQAAVARQPARVQQASHSSATRGRRQ